MILQLIVAFSVFILIVSSKGETVSWDVNTNINNSGMSFKDLTSHVRPAFNDSLTMKMPNSGKAAQRSTSSFSNIEEFIKKKCPKFKITKTKFNIHSMPDIWQTAYYELPKKMQCFKIHIKKVSFEEKVLNELKYGNFSDKVNWKDCHLEIHSATKLNRVHFLQGHNDEYGVLDNVIIERIPPTSDITDPSYILIEESPDQWLVLNNLMLMRDCYDAGTVVFSRLPWQPGQFDIRNALSEFGEAKMNGTMACRDEELVNKTFEDDEISGPM